MTVKIGYMGVPFSNTWEKAKEFSEEMELDSELVPLMCAKDTVAALEAGEVDYGVLAYSNNLAGTVKETSDAMKGKILEVVAGLEEETPDGGVGYLIFGQHDRAHV